MSLIDKLRRTSTFTAAIDVARRTLPAPILVWVRSRMISNLRGGSREVFGQIYQRNIWGYQETASGGGATLAYTEPIRKGLPNLIAELQVRTLLDIPCGDFNWMRKVDLPGVRYIGGDIVEEAVAKLKAQHSRPDREFRVIDLCNDPLPNADALLCRDCLMHLSEDMIFKALANILRSEVKYLLLSTYPEGQNRSIRLGDWFPINVCAAPYNVPTPTQAVEDDTALRQAAARGLGCGCLARVGVLVRRSAVALLRSLEQSHAISASLATVTLVPARPRQRAGSAMGGKLIDQERATRSSPLA